MISAPEIIDGLLASAISDELSDACTFCGASARESRLYLKGCRFCLKSEHNGFNARGHAALSEGIPYREYFGNGKYGEWKK